MSLKSEVYGLLNHAKKLCQDCQGTEQLIDCFTKMQKRLDTPLRVAVVGVMKSGKSTFMNALMGADILRTGNLETTYTVSWFQYGDTPFLTVCFRNGEILEAPFEDLYKWSVREYEKENPKISDVKYLIIHYPSEILKTIEFIDTPGLNSVYGTDSGNTLDFLSVNSSKDTLYEASMADAVIYTFNRTVAGFDKDILDSFLSERNAISPINAIGIMTKVDTSGIWDIFSGKSPVESADAVISNMMEQAGVKNVLFSIFPVCAKAVEGYERLDAQDWRLLGTFAKLNSDKMADLLYDAEAFISGDSISETERNLADFGSIEKRKYLMDKIGQYGILTIVNCLREGKEKEDIRKVLSKECGILTVYDILLKHFGSRMFLIKTKYVFSYMKDIIKNVKKEAGANLQMRDICEQILEEIDGLMSSVQTLQELKALQMYYSGQITFQNKCEEEDFLRVTGEYGRSVEIRLGMEEGCSIMQLEQAAKEKVALWHEKAGDFMRSGAYVEMASILARSYEQMYYHLNALCGE